MPERDLALLIAAAEEAGALALGYWKRDPKFWDKAAGAGPVSEADLAVDALLRERLLAARPDYGWLSEESPDDGSRFRARRSFILDPIDGTRAFLAGETGFGPALAVIEDGRAIAGVFHMPATGVTYAAAAGGVATRNSLPIRVSQQRDPDGARVLSSVPPLRPEYWTGAVPAMTRSFRPALAHRLCLLAEGATDVVLTQRPAWEWDVAAALLIAERAGAASSDWLAKPVTFNAPDPRVPGLIVANPVLHAGLLARRGFAVRTSDASAE